ncbi:hypothetical protein [Arthrobacter sp. DR-2P]|nr:hypothetical protein [Arthrobacter sp. DR-2P]
MSTSPSAQVEDAQGGAPTAEFIGKREHVLGGSPEPFQSRDDEGVTLHKGIKRS